MADLDSSQPGLAPRSFRLIAMAIDVAIVAALGVPGGIALGAGGISALSLALGSSGRHSLTTAAWGTGAMVVAVLCGFAASSATAWLSS